VDALGVEKNALSQGRFSRVDVGADTDVSDVSDVFFHLAFLSTWIKNPHLPRCAMGVIKQ
jgi:hypothetical protein